MWDTVGLPPRDRVDTFYREGWWRRESTLLDDLTAHAGSRPEHPAIIGYEDGAQARTLTYRELADAVERIAAGLAGLGVGRRDVVVAYLPNRWQLVPLYLACMRIGAVASPVIPTLAERELRIVLEATGAPVCVSAGEFGGVDYSARVADAAPPSLRHQLVTSDLDVLAGGGALPDPAGADDPALLLYTSGTAGPMKGVVHTPNTLYAAARAASEPHYLGADDVVSIPNYLTHMAGATYAGLMPVLLGATSVVQDTNTDMALFLDIVERHGVTWPYLSPSYLVQLLDEQRARPRDTSSLARITSGSAPVHPDLIRQVREVFDVALHTLWGMTENGTVTVGRPEDEDGWSAHSDGQAMPWMDLRIDADPDDADGAGRLWVRGASQCLGYLDARATYEAALDGDGWFDTGDLARWDGRGGIRITGRRTDLITRASGQKVSTLEVEGLLRRHPNVADVALVGYPDPSVPGAELACAVVVFRDQPPMLAELQRYLDSEQVARVLWPDRVQFVWELPKNAIGKVLRDPLRKRLELAAGSP